MCLTKFKIEDAKSEVSKKVVYKREQSAFRGASLNKVWMGSFHQSLSKCSLIFLYITQYFKWFKSHILEHEKVQDGWKWEGFYHLITVLPRYATQ